MDKVFVLLSGGIDSTTTLAMAREDFPKAEFEAVSMDYGQRHRKEMDRAKQICDHYGIPHHIQPLPNMMQGMLVDKGEQNEVIPKASYADLPQGISPTYVTFRNGLMLSVLAARAQGWVMEQQKRYTEDKVIDAGPYGKTSKAAFDAISGNKQLFDAYIYCGVHADDGANWAYPDCTPEFIGGMANAIFIGSYNRVRLRTPLLFMSKAEVVRNGLRLDAPYELTWSCYVGEDKHCGECPTCLSRKEAFEHLGEADPTEYAK